jgi:hypothetical protein
MCPKSARSTFAPPSSVINTVLTRSFCPTVVVPPHDPASASARYISEDDYILTTVRNESENRDFRVLQFEPNADNRNKLFIELAGYDLRPAVLPALRRFMGNKKVLATMTTFECVQAGGKPGKPFLKALQNVTAEVPSVCPQWAHAHSMLVVLEAEPSPIKSLLIGDDDERDITSGLSKAFVRGCGTYQNRLWETAHSRTAGSGDTSPASTSRSGGGGGGNKQ